MVLDDKVAQGKAYVSEFARRYMGPTATISIASSLPNIIHCTLILDDDECTEQVPSKERLLLLKELVMERNIISDTKLCVNILGRLRVFRVSCLPREGVVVRSSKIEFETVTSSFDAGTPRGFERVGGLEKIVEELLKMIHKPLSNPSAYREYGIQPPRGILLYGPPGTGKTLLAHAICEELRDTFVESVKATDLSGGDSDMRIHSFFSGARQKCLEEGRSSMVLFIDELDILCPSRDGDVGEYERRAVGALLTELDGFETKNALARDHVPFVVIGATNRPNAIDNAMRRPGRFDKEIEIAPPTMDGRRQILEIFSKHQFRKVWSPSNDDLKAIASLTHGFVGADLQSLLSQASFAAIENGSPLTQEIIMKQLVHVRPSALRELVVSIPKTTWSDIGGYQNVKQQLIESVIWPVTFAEEFTRLGVDPPRGILLYGPPGCSKTMMARAVATESSMNFVAVKGPEIFSKWVGQSEQAIRDLFRKARQASPCIIFFDEIDAIASSRDAGDGGVSGRVLTQLLTEMDGISSSKQIIVIAATNRPHVIDSALMRPGRLDRVIYVGLPDALARESIWESLLAKIPHQFDQFDLKYMEVLVQMTEGFSGAEIVSVVKETAILCMRQCIERIAPTITFENETETKIASPSFDGRVLSWQHVALVLGQIKPRTDKNLLKLLKEFSSGPILD